MGGNAHHASDVYFPRFMRGADSVVSVGGALRFGRCADDDSATPPIAGLRAGDSVFAIKEWGVLRESLTQAWQGDEKEK
ncbi:hypothetical protein MY4038_009053, partial [Beauveria bassiana]